MQRSRIALSAFAASSRLLSTSSTNTDNGGKNDGPAAAASDSATAAEKNDAASANVNFETKADDSFFRAQQQSKMRNPVDGPEYNQRIPGAGEEGYSRSLPTAAKYRALSNDELIQMLKLRDKQIADIRHIYENFHNEVEKQYRKQIFDYHDKAISFSQTHGQMQNQSINHTREALVKLREQEELEHRDLKIVYTVCLVATIAFWLWVRSHYIAKADLEHASPTEGGEAPFTLRTDGMSLTPGLVNRLMGTGRETWFEKEQRLEREAVAQDAKDRAEAKERRLALVASADGGEGAEAEVAVLESISAAVTSDEKRAARRVGGGSQGFAAEVKSTPEEDARDAIRKQRAWR